MSKETEIQFALQDDNPALALRLATQALKKDKQSQTLRVLQALALDGLEKRNECNRCSELHALCSSVRFV